MVYKSHSLIPCQSQQQVQENSQCVWRFAQGFRESHPAVAESGGWIGGGGGAGYLHVTPVELSTSLVADNKSCFFLSLLSNPFRKLRAAWASSGEDWWTSLRLTRDRGGRTKPTQARWPVECLC